MMHQSDEEEDEDSDEAEEDSDEKCEEYDEEEITSTRNDLGVQTSFDCSDSETRFRGKTFSPSMNQQNNQSFPIKSQHLRENIDKFGSLNEALSTLPTNKHPPASRPQMTTQQASPLTQATRNQSRQSYSRTEDRSPSRLIPSIIMSIAFFFFLFLVYQYVNLASDQNQQKISICTNNHAKTSCIP